MIACDEDGRVLELKLAACIPPNEDRSRPGNLPQGEPVIVALVSIMMLNHQIVTGHPSPEVLKSRQQRRFEAAHPDRTEPPLVKFYTLKLDVERMATEAGTSGRDGWDQAFHMMGKAWHRVRSFPRQLPSGRIVTVKAHSRGNPLKGIILKDYKIKAPKKNENEES